MQPVTTLPPEARRLLQLARRLVDGTADDTSPAAVDWQRLVLLAPLHHVHPLLYRDLLTADRADVPRAVRAHSQSHWTLAVAQSLWQEEALRRCVTTLEAAGIRVIPIKGLVLGHLLYGDPALRPSVDLDLLVPQAQWAPAVPVLEGLGYRRAGGSPPAWFRLRHGKDASFIRPRSCVELHWTFAPPRPNAIDPDFAWRRAVRRRVGTLDVLTLSWEDQLLTLAMHLRRNLQHLQLKHVLDIALLLARQGRALDWAYVWKQAKFLRLRRTVLYALTLARNVLGASLTEGAAAQMAAGWRGALWSRWAGWELPWTLAPGRRRRAQALAALWKCTLMDGGGDAVLAICKTAWWQWDAWWLGRRRADVMPAAHSPRQDAPSEGGETQEVASPEPPGMA